MVNRLESDMQKHFGDRLHQLMLDTANTCEIAGMDRNSVGAMMLSVFLYEVSMAAHTMKLSKIDFIKICLMARQTQVENMQ